MAKYGSVDASDDGGKRQRNVAFVVDVPGYGFPTAATLEYRERYKRSAQGWLRDAYAFEYRTAEPPSRRAHHQHVGWGIHQHCEPIGKKSDEHFEDVERLLLPTHEDFSGFYDRAEPILCLGLKRKQV
ncbi:MAG TPA: hypothetical protein VMQ78_10360 [Candidatus Limnocylindria bacterium]|nr:hypothetical protein [Candidatus Limnocylindria bacterium]